MSDLRVVFGPDAVTHWGTVVELVSGALAANEVTGELVPTSDSAEFAAALRAAGPHEEFIVVPGAATMPDVADRRLLRVDFGRYPLDLSPGIVRHFRGRGLDGLDHAVACWYHRRCHPPTTLTYGTHPYQRVECRTPEGPGPFPVAVLIHGGYWKPWWDSDLMDAMAVDLTARGYATWNIEYRRPLESDWDTTTADVATAFAALATAPHAARLDLDRIVVLGHSAGGQLAFRSAADTATAQLRPALAVSLAGILDLDTARQRQLGENAVAIALDLAEFPERIHASSPIERLPLGVRQLVVCGLNDEPDLLEISRHYADRAAAAGDRIDTLEAAGDHFAVVRPDTEIWCGTAQWITDNL